MRSTQLARRHDAIATPVIAVADVHVLDEAHDDAGAAEVLDQVEHGVIVQAALDDAVDLDRRQPRVLRGANALEHAVALGEAAAHLLEDLRIERVETDGDAMQAVRLQLRRMLREQHAVGRQRDVLHAFERGELADQLGDIRAQQRLAAGEPHLLHAELHEQARQPRDLFERQALGRLQEAIVLVKRLPRHAVRAAEVAAIHHRNAQVVQRPIQRVARPRVHGQGDDGVAFGHGWCRAR